MPIMAFKYGGPPIHPGEVLREDYLVPLGMSENELAAQLRVPVSRINDIVKERRGITADTALRLARYFGGDAQSWINLQGLYDLRTAEIAHAASINEQIKPAAPSWSIRRRGGSTEDPDPSSPAPRRSRTPGRKLERRDN
jgi:addiction module HigA family antidote